MTTHETRRIDLEDVAVVELAGGPSTAYSPERRLLEALIEIRQRDHAPPATVKLLVSTERTSA